MDIYECSLSSMRTKIGTLVEHVLEIFWSEKYAVLLNCQWKYLSSIASTAFHFLTLKYTLRKYTYLEDFERLEEAAWFSSIKNKTRAVFLPRTFCLFCFPLFLLFSTFFARNMVPLDSIFFQSIGSLNLFFKLFKM